VLWPLALALALVAYNTFLPLLACRFHERVYVPLNGTLALLLVVGARWGLGVSWEGLGLGGRGLLPGIGWGVAVGLALGGPAVLGAWLFPKVARLVRGFAPPDIPPTTRALLYHLLLRIPVGTALFEEVAFRGVLYGLLLQWGGTLWALLGSSAAFSLWHIGPILLRMQHWEVGGVWGTSLHWIGGLGGTFLGGLLLGGMRWATGSLAAPLLAHALLNTLGLLAWVLLRKPPVSS